MIIIENSIATLSKEISITQQNNIIWYIILQNKYTYVLIEIFISKRKYMNLHTLLNKPSKLLVLVSVSWLRQPKVYIQIQMNIVLVKVNSNLIKMLLVVQLLIEGKKRVKFRIEKWKYMKDKRLKLRYKFIGI